MEFKQSYLIAICPLNKKTPFQCSKVKYCSTKYKIQETINSWLKQPTLYTKHNNNNFQLLVFSDYEQ